MRVYLGGAINGCTDAEASGWREAVKAVLRERDIEWRDPMDRDYRGMEMQPGITERIVEGDKDDIRQCDVMLMNCPKPSWGTAMEIMYGFELRYGLMHPPRIVVVIPEGVTPSPWLVYHADEIHVGSAVEAAREL